jgi:hypothetical protein
MKRPSDQGRLPLLVRDAYAAVLSVQPAEAKARSCRVALVADPRRIARMRHDGCGGREGKVELLTWIEGASSRPVRRIVVVGG